MKRILAVIALALAVLASFHPTGAQPPKKVWRIGILTMSWAPWHNQTQGFRERLKRTRLYGGEKPHL